MSILPTTSNPSSFYDGGANRRGKHGPALLRRMLRFPQMDFEVLQKRGRVREKG